MNKDAEGDDGMLDGYDFSGGVRGKYADQYAKGTNIMLLDPDVSEVFPDARSVNEALRAIANIVRQRREELPDAEK